MRLRRNAKVDLLRNVPLFAECSQRELGQISALADELFQPEGTTLISEGSKGREFFVLVDGSVDVRREGRRLNSLGAPSFFGEIALVSDTPRTATVTASSAVRLLVITAQAFQRLLLDTPSIRPKVLAALAERVTPSTQ